MISSTEVQNRAQMREQERDPFKKCVSSQQAIVSSGCLFIFVVQDECHFNMKVQKNSGIERYFTRNISDILLPFLTADFVPVQAGRNNYSHRQVCVHGRYYSLVICKNSL